MLGPWPSARLRRSNNRPRERSSQPSRRGSVGSEIDEHAALPACALEAKDDDHPVASIQELLGHHVEVLEDRPTYAQRAQDALATAIHLWIRDLGTVMNLDLRVG
jgi:hypothetical protein